MIINYVSLLVTLTALAFVLLPTHRQDQITTLLIIGLIMILLALFYATVMDSRCVAETGPDMDLLRGATSDFNE